MNVFHVYSAAPSAHPVSSYKKTGVKGSSTQGILPGAPGVGQVWFVGQKPLPQKLYHFTTWENWQRIQQSGGLAPSRYGGFDMNGIFAVDLDDLMLGNWKTSGWISHLMGHLVQKAQGNDIVLLEINMPVHPNANMRIRDFSAVSEKMRHQLGQVLSNPAALQQENMNGEEISLGQVFEKILKKAFNPIHWEQQDHSLSIAEYVSKEDSPIFKAPEYIILENVNLDKIRYISRITSKGLDISGYPLVVPSVEMAEDFLEKLLQSGASVA